MRIGFDAKRLFNNFTGLGNYSRFIVNSIHQQYPNHPLFLFTPKIKSNSDVNPFLEPQHYTTVVPSTITKKLKLGSLWRTFKISKEAKKHKLDIFHGLSHELPFNITKSCKAVVTIHDLIFLRYPQFYKPIDRFIYTEKIKYACKKADAVVAISQQTKNDLIEFLHIPEEKIRVVYQGCHPNFTREISAEQVDQVRVKYNLPEHFLLNVGTLEPRKNALLILQALKNLRASGTDSNLVLVGRATAYTETLKQFVAEHELTNQVRFIHKAAFTDLPAIYKASTAFIYPSFFEGFGIPLVEAIACGVPVITSTGSCFSEAAGPDAIYVDPNDAQALTEAIQRVTQDVTLRKEMIERSTQYIQRFASSQVAKDMMQVYESVLK